MALSEFRGLCPSFGGPGSAAELLTLAGDPGQLAGLSALLRHPSRAFPVPPHPGHWAPTVPRAPSVLQAEPGRAGRGDSAGGDGLAAGNAEGLIQPR